MTETFLSTAEAAEALEVTPTLLRHCAQTFAFPEPQIQQGRRSFARAEVLALRSALASHSSLAAAVTDARSLLAPSRSGCFGTAAG